MAKTKKPFKTVSDILSETAQEKIFSSQGANPFLNAGLNLAGGLAGTAVSGELVPDSIQSNLGSVTGGIAGSLAIPIPGVGSFIGSTLGGLIGGAFGPERLSMTEKNFASEFSMLTNEGFDPFEALALVRLKNRGTGSDNIADGLNVAIGRDIFPGTSFLRDEGDQGLSLMDELNQFPESVNSLTVRGLKQLSDKGILSKEEIQMSLTEDLSLFKSEPLDNLFNTNAVKRGEPQKEMSTQQPFVARTITGDESPGNDLFASLDFSKFRR